jgi:S-formylglutathione hydrolase
LRNPLQYRSVSAFAPIVAPSQVPWGVKAFTGYLGAATASWNDYDASRLAARSPFAGEVLIDQGLADKFLDTQLQPQRFVEACEGTGIKPRLRMHAGYDHGYWFIQSFIADHMRFHAERLER